MTTDEVWNPPEVVEELVNEWLPYFMKVAQRRYAKSLMPNIDWDLMESGVHFGLLHAAQHFNPNGAASFKTYAYKRVLGAVLDAVREFDHRPRTAISDKEPHIITHSVDAIMDHNEGLGERWEFLQVVACDPEPDEFEDILPGGIQGDELEIITRYCTTDESMKQIGESMGRTEGWAFSVYNMAMGYIRDVAVRDKAYAAGMPEDVYEEALFRRAS